MNLDLEFIEVKKFAILSPSIGSNLLIRIRHQYEMRKILINIIESASSSDIVYLRYPYPLFYMMLPFSRHRRTCKIVNEHNTIERNEFKFLRSYLDLLVDFFAGYFIRRNADGIVGVTNEITSHEVMRSGDPKKPFITIGNGIDVNRIKLCKPSGIINKVLQLICVASFNRWHGIDRLLRGLAYYGGSWKVRLFIVGGGSELHNLRILVKDLKLEECVLFTGILGGSILDDLFDKSHIAVGSLGLHRMDMKEGSILKAREYCARGIPFLYGCSDPDFPNDFPYIMRIAGDETPINIEEVISFAEGVYSDPEHHIKMNVYAKENLDWSVKMKKLKDFCEALVEE